MTNLENQLQCTTKFVLKALKDLFFVLIMFITAENMSCVHIKGKSGQKISKAQMKEHDKCKKKHEPSLTSLCQMVLEISHFKVRKRRLLVGF